jgi:hypothetical protein
MRRGNDGKAADKQRFGVELLNSKLVFSNDNSEKREVKDINLTPNCFQLFL